MGSCASGLPGIKLKVVGSEDMGDSPDPYFTVKPDRLQSFRLLVTVPPGTLKDDAADLRFVLGDDETVLNHRIESFDALLGVAYIWVDVPEIQATI